jgi:hypothetical protein
MGVVADLSNSIAKSGWIPLPKSLQDILPFPPASTSLNNLATRIVLEALTDQSHFKVISSDELKQ